MDAMVNSPGGMQLNLMKSLFNENTLAHNKAKDDARSIKVTNIHVIIMKTW